MPHAAPQEPDCFPRPTTPRAAFYDAFERADLAAMMAVWAEDDDIVCVHPAGPAPAWASRRCARAGRRSSPSGIALRIRTIDARRSTGQTMAVHSVVEMLSAPGEQAPSPPVSATNVYVLTENGWRMTRAPRLARAPKPRSRCARAADRAAHAPLTRLAAFIDRGRSCCAAVRLAHAADPRKVIRYASPSAESKLDPAAESDEASGSISHVIFDSLLTYDFLARPAKLKPQHGGGAARGDRRRRHVHAAHQAGHLLHARSGLRRQAARADGARLRLLDQAPLRPEADAASGCSWWRARSRAATRR